MSGLHELCHDVRPRPQRAPTQLCLCAAGRPDLCVVPNMEIQEIVKDGHFWGPQPDFELCSMLDKGIPNPC